MGARVPYLPWRCGSAVLLRAQGLAGEAELTAAFNAARDREYGDEQLCGKQAGLDQLAEC